MSKKLWQDWANLVFGLWLFFSPWLGLGSTESAAWNSWIFGAVIAILTIAALSAPQKWEEWTNMFVGIWLIIAPFALGFAGETGAMWNHIIIGLLVAVDAIWALMVPPHRVVAQV